MISKLVPPPSGLISLIISYTTYGVARTLLLVPISINTKLDNFVHHNKLAPYEFAPL